MVKRVNARVAETRQTPIQDEISLFTSYKCPATSAPRPVREDLVCTGLVSTTSLDEPLLTQLPQNERQGASAPRHLLLQLGVPDVAKSRSFI